MSHSPVLAAGLVAGIVVALGCASEEPVAVPSASDVPVPDHSLGVENTHNKFSRTIPPVLRINSGDVVEVFTKEASDGQLRPDSTSAEIRTLDFDPIHPLTGPIWVDGAQPGDVLAVEVHRIEVGDWGWTAVVPGFGFLANEFTEPYLKTFDLGPDAESVEFLPGIRLPIRPFAGVMGVAPDTAEAMSTIPPRANGGNMDNPFLTEGTRVYFPVFVEGALFSVGDTHAAQGLGEVSGTGIEAPMRLVLEFNVLKDRTPISEPQYETSTHYAVTAFAEDLDEAARKATRYMVEHLVTERALDRTDAYVLCSLAGEMHIAEVVDTPHMLVVMHMPQHIFE